MEKIKLLMIDDNIELIGAVREYLKDNDNMEIVYEAHNGEEGISLIEKEGQ